MLYLGNKICNKERLKITKHCKKHSIEYVGIIRKNDSFDLIECKCHCLKCKETKMQIKG